MTGTTRPAASGGPTGRLLRAGAVVLAALAAAAASLTLGITPLLDLSAHLRAGAPWSALPFDLLIGCLAAVTLICCGCWLVCVTVSTAVEAVTGASSAAIRAVSPHVVRRLVLVCCGVAVGGTGLVTPAVAVAEEPGELEGARTARIGTDSLSGLPLPDRTLGEHLDETARPRSGLAAEAVRRAAARHDASAPARPDRVDAPGTSRRRDNRSTLRVRPLVTPATDAEPMATDAEPVATTAEPVATAAGVDEDTHRVRPGDSLWSIADRHMPGAQPTEIDAGWRRIHRDNRAVIGPDPDLIIPGTTLRLPGRADIPAHNGAPGESATTPHRKDAS